MHTSLHSVVVLQCVRLRHFSSFEPLARGGRSLRDAAVRPLPIHPCISVKFYFLRHFYVIWIMRAFTIGWKL